MVTGPVDGGLLDNEVLEEIEMTTNLMIAASVSDRCLTQAQVDAALGLPGGSCCSAG